MDIDLRRGEVHDARGVIEALLKASDEFADAAEGRQGANYLIGARYAAHDCHELTLPGEAYVEVSGGDKTRERGGPHSGERCLEVLFTRFLRPSRGPPPPGDAEGVLVGDVGRPVPLPLFPANEVSRNSLVARKLMIAFIHVRRLFPSLFAK